MFNTLSPKGNTNPNNIEIPSYPNLNGCPRKSKQQMLVRMQGEKEPYTLLVGM
jgi:hypothetical protein